MKKTIGSSVVKLALMVAVGVGLGVTPASAQSVKASFTLPSAVRWGLATLPAGDYTITLNSTRGPALVRSSSGQGLALVIPVTTNPAIADAPSGLVLGVVEDGYEVRSLNLREANVSLAYRFSKKVERKIAAKRDAAEVVAARLEGK